MLITEDGFELMKQINIAEDIRLYLLDQVYKDKDESTAKVLA